MEGHNDSIMAVVETNTIRSYEKSDIEPVSQTGC